MIISRNKNCTNNMQNLINTIWPRWPFITRMFSINCAANFAFFVLSPKLKMAGKVPSVGEKCFQCAPSLYG